MSQITKRALASALKELLEHKPLNKITIADITEQCGVNRQTFYYHFQDIMEVVEWYQDQALRQSIEKSLAAPSYKEAIRGVVYETFQHRQLILQLIIPSGTLPAPKGDGAPLFQGGADLSPGTASRQGGRCLRLFRGY